METEIKVRVDDADAVRRALELLHAEVAAPRHFEDNHVLDFPDLRLGTAGCLLRIRFAAGRSTLTFKGAAVPHGPFKSREELETGVDDGRVLLEVLGRTGMRVCFRYQKYRSEFALDGVHVALDETPIGTFVEFEGTEDCIRALARKMEIGEPRFLRHSYYDLYLDHCRRAGVSPSFMVY